MSRRSVSLVLAGFVLLVGSLASTPLAVQWIRYPTAGVLIKERPIVEAELIDEVRLENERSLQHKVNPRSVARDRTSGANRGQCFGTPRRWMAKLSCLDQVGLRSDIRFRTADAKRSFKVDVCARPAISRDLCVFMTL